MSADTRTVLKGCAYTLATVVTLGLLFAHRVHVI